MKVLFERKAAGRADGARALSLRKPGLGGEIVQGEGALPPCQRPSLFKLHLDGIDLLTALPRARSLADSVDFDRNLAVRCHDLCSHVVQDRAISDPDRMALRCGLLALGYADLHRAMVQAVRRLRSLGVRRGDRVIVVAESGFQAVALILALGELKACTLVANARMSEGDLKSIRSSNGYPRAIYCAGDSRAAAAHAKQELFQSIVSLLGPVTVQKITRPRDATQNRERRLAPTITFVATDPRGPCSTFNHRRLLQKAACLAKACAIGADDVIYNCAPVFGFPGFLATLTALHSGAGVELVAEPDVKHFARTLEEGRLSYLIASSEFFSDILAYGRVSNHALQSRRLRVGLFRGASVRPRP